MTLRLDFGSSMPNKVQWLLIGEFIIGALAMIPAYIVLSPQVAGYILLISGLIALATKIVTTEPKPEPVPVPAP